MNKSITPLLFVLFCCSLLVAQYPKDERIDPYPKPVKQRALVQRFECGSESVTRWKALHQSSLSATEHSVRIDSTGHDPYVLLPEFAPAGPGTFEFRIRMKNGMNPKAEVFWTTDKRPDFHGDFSVRFGFLRDGRVRDYAALFKTTDSLTRLRFDPGTSAGECEIDWVELYKIDFDETEKNHTPWFDPDWAVKVKGWKKISSGNIAVRFDAGGTGAQILVDDVHVGDIYPLAHQNPDLPLGGTAEVPLVRPDRTTGEKSGPIRFELLDLENSSVLLIDREGDRKLSFSIENGGIRFKMDCDENCFGPVFRPKEPMKQALLCGVEYLEEGEHSSSTADIETPEHLRFAPKALDLTWPFMAIVTKKTGFGLLWDDPATQSVFATPDFILDDPNGHYMGLYGATFSGTFKIIVKTETTLPGFSPLDELVLWAVKKRGLPELPARPRDDEAQRKLNLAAFEKSLIVVPGEGWRHAVVPGAPKQTFPPSFGNDYVSVVRQLSGKLPDVPRLGHGGGHLRNPLSFFLMGKANEFLDWTRNESKQLRDRQREDGSFGYAGKYLKGHWSDTASGHCGNSLYRLMYNYRMLGEPETLAAAIKGFEFANQYTTPRGAQVWELSLHTPDIMGSSRMCMANVWAFEATGETKYLDAARRWAVTGLPFVYLWERKSGDIQKYATTPVFGATNWTAPNWIGLPVQWCGLDYSEALFLLAGHDRTIDWKKIAEGILLAAEQMQYPDGECTGLLPDSFSLDTQKRNPADINPSVLVMQRRRLQGELPDVAVGPDGKHRIVSPFKTTIENDGGKAVAVIEAESGIDYQVLIDGREIRTIRSEGVDRIRF